MEYLNIRLISLLPVTELRGAIPIGIAQDLSPIGVYVSSVLGSTIISIPLIISFRKVLNFIRGITFMEVIVKKIDTRIDLAMKKLKSATILGLILFVGIPLPTTGTWTAAAIASILCMRMRDAFIGIFIGNMVSGIIVSAISMHLI